MVDPDHAPVADRDQPLLLQMPQRLPLRGYSQAWLAERTIRGRPLAVRTRETRQHSLDRWVLPGIGRTHARTHVLLLLLVQDLHVRVVHAATGELPRELTIDPTRDHQPTGRPPGPTGK